MATLTEAMLNDLNTGNAVLKILPYTPGTGANLASLDFSDADELFTLENSFQIQRDAASFSSTKIDQRHRIIEYGAETGENYTMQGNVPSVAIALMSMFFEEGSASSISVKNGSKTYSGTKAYKYGGLEKEFSVLTVSQTENTAIVFGRVKFIFSEPQHDDNTTPTYVHFDAAMMPNEHASGDWAPLPTVANTPNNG